MGETKRIREALYLDPEKFELLVQLSTKTRILRSVLLREAVDDLLIKHKLMTEDGKPKVARKKT